MSLRRQFFKFVIPSVVSMWIYSLYTIVDGIFVANGVGEEALAAVNLCQPFVNVMFAIGIFFATGTSTVISLELGKGDRTRACRYFNQNLWVVAIFCLTFSTLTLLLVNPLARLLGGSEGTLQYVKEYLMTIAPFAIFFAISYNLEIQVKADGSPQVSTIGVLSCGLANVVLDYLFVIRFGWGVWGAALATGLAQSISTVVFVVYFLFRKKRLQFGRFGRELSVYKRIVPLGLPEGLNEFFTGLVILAFNLAIIRVLGADKVTSYTIISYVHVMVLMTMSGASQGLQPLVSYNLGAGDRKTCHKLLRYGLAFCGTASLLLFGITMIFAPDITGWFLEESSDLFGYTAYALRLFSPAFLLCGVNVTMSAFFTAVEKPRFAFPIAVSRGFVLMFLSLAITAFVIGGDAIWLTATLAEALCLVLTAVFSIQYYKECRKA